MPPTPTVYYQGTPTPADLSALIPVSYMGISVQRGVNATPLFSRFRKVAVDGYVIQRYVGSGRPGSTTVGGAGIPDAVATTIPLANVGAWMRGDVMQLNSGEFIQLTDHPNATNNTITVRRGIAGTVAAAQAAGTTVKLIANARVGNEVFQPTYQQTPGYVQQYVQTFQFPYEVAGGVEAIRLRYDNGDVLQGERGRKEVDLRNDLERAALYGLPETVGGAVNSYKMAGLFSLIQTNNITAPANAGTFRPSDLNSQVLAPLYGKDMNLALVSPGFFQSLPIWGMQAQRLNAGSNIFGTPIDAWATSGFPQFTFVPVPTMQGISGIFGRAEDVYWGILRPINDVRHGINGDASGGHWIAAGAIDIEDERNFVAIRNITAFAPQS